MNLRASLVAPLALAALISLAASARAQVTLPMYLDDSYNGKIDGNIVGTGTFTFNSDPGNGDWTAAQLGGVDYSFLIAGASYASAAGQDLTSVYFPYDTTYRLSGSGKTRRIQFLPDDQYTSKYMYNYYYEYQVYFDFLGQPGNYGLFINGAYYPGDYYIGALSADVPEPGVVAFGIVAAGGVLGLIARRRK